MYVTFIEQNAQRAEQKDNNMKTFKKFAAQGDLALIAIDALPAGIKPAAVAKEGKIVLAHSETGHHHAIETVDPNVVQFYTTENPRLSYLEVKAPTELKHFRPFDTHEALSIPVGFYEVRRQREYTPGGDRMVQD